MMIEDLWQTLKTTGGYRTVPWQHKSLYGRFLGRFDFFYYADISTVTLSARCATGLGRFDRRTWAQHALRMLIAAERCGGQAHFSGYENLKSADFPVVYVSNHMSTLETFVLPGTLLGFSDAATVVKASLLKYPIFGPVMRATEPISVSRRDPRDDLKTVLSKGEEFLKAGRSIIIFPQSTRSTEFDPAAFNSLGVKLAKRAGVKLVPVAVKMDFQGIGTGSGLFRDYGPVSRDKPIYIKIGTPLTITGNGRDAHEASISFITDALRSWGGIVKDSGRGATEAATIEQRADGEPA